MDSTSTATLRAPATRYEVEHWVDLRDAGTRERLTASAVPGFVRLARAWGLSVDQTCALLGDVPASTWHAWKATAPADLGVDRLTRVSYLLGIYSALHVIYTGPLADAWLTRPNTNALFGGATPLEVLMRGGIPAMAAVRQYLDSQRGGV
jgi:hypothetical protein